jgi:hypothetical protein
MNLLTWHILGHLYQESTKLHRCGWEIGSCCGLIYYAGCYCYSCVQVHACLPSACIGVGVGWPQPSFCRHLSGIVCIHTPQSVHTLTSTHTHRCSRYMYTHTCRHMHVHAHIHMCAHTHTHTYTHTHAHTHAPTQHARMHARTPHKPSNLYSYVGYFQ